MADNSDRRWDGASYYHCIYPQPGCDISVLPARWKERATQIISEFRLDRFEDGLKYQGCCCAYGDHALLSDDRVDELKRAGFLVELDSDVLERD